MSKTLLGICRFIADYLDLVQGHMCRKHNLQIVCVCWGRGGGGGEACVRACFRFVSDLLVITHVQIPYTVMYARCDYCVN